MNKLRIRFGEPQHKWLPVQLSVNDFSLEFEASCILQNPIEQSIEALILVAQGIDAEVLWYLEPQECSFRFKSEIEKVSLLIVAKEKGRTETKLYQIQGDFQSIVLPYWRAIKARFANTQIAAKHWPVFSDEQLLKLEAVIKAKLSS